MSDKTDAQLLEMADRWHAPHCIVDAGGGCIVDMDEKEAFVAGYRVREAEDERLRAVVDAARAARGVTGNLNLHAARCQNSPCDVCDDLTELEHDAENELDMELAAFDRANAS